LIAEDLEEGDNRVWVKERGWLGSKPTIPNTNSFSLIMLTIAIESCWGQNVSISLSRSKYHWWHTYARRYMLFSRLAAPMKILNSPFMWLQFWYGMDQMIQPSTWRHDLSEYSIHPLVHMEANLGYKITHIRPTILTKYLMSIEFTWT
jgi:hypothetical protein